MPSFLKKLIKHPVKVITAPIREVVKHVPLVGHSADKVLREAARVVDNTAGAAVNLVGEVVDLVGDMAHDTVDIVTGKSKIKKQAEQQIQKSKIEFDRMKNNSLNDLDISYQESLQEIQVVMQNIEAEKQRLLDQKAVDLEVNYDQAMQLLITGSAVAEDATRLLTAARDDGMQSIETLDQQFQEQMLAFAEEINARYQPLLEQCDNDLQAITAYEQAMALEYENQYGSIVAQYNSQLQDIISNIQERKKKAIKKANINFAITVGSSIVARVVAPKIVAALQIQTKVGAAMVNATTFSTVNSIATGQIARLPSIVLKNTLTSGALAITGLDTAFIGREEIATSSQQGLQQLAQTASVAGVRAAVLGENIVGAVIAAGLQEGMIDIAITAVKGLYSPDNNMPIHTPDNNMEPKNTNTMADINPFGLEKVRTIDDKYGLFISNAKARDYWRGHSLEAVAEAASSSNASDNLSVMQSNNTFHPIPAIYSHRVSLFNNPTSEYRTTHAYDLVSYGNEKANIGFRPYISSHTSIERSHLAPNLQASVSTDISFGVNIANIQHRNFSVGLDVLRFDKSDTLQMSARPKILFGYSQAGILMNDFVQHKRGALATVSAQLTDVPVPLLGSCNGTVRADFIGFNSNTQVTKKALFYTADFTADISCARTNIDPLAPNVKANKLIP